MDIGHIHMLGHIFECFVLIFMHIFLCILSVAWIEMKYFETKDCLVSLTRGATTVVWIGLVEVNILLLVGSVLVPSCF